MDSKEEKILLRLLAGFVFFMGAAFLCFIASICFSVLSDKCS